MACGLNICLRGHLAVRTYTVIYETASESYSINLISVSYLLIILHKHWLICTVKLVSMNTSVIFLSVEKMV